jgi:transcriptional regulator with XRE-family HTH domain
MRKSIPDDHYLRLRTLLRDIRKRAGLTQAQLAARLGVPQSLVAKVENGERRLDVLEFAAYVRAMGGAPGKVFGRATASFNR